MNIINSDERGFRLDSDNLENLEKDIESVCFTRPFLNRLKKELLKDSEGDILDTIAKLKENNSDDEVDIIYKKPKVLLNEKFQGTSNIGNNVVFDSDNESVKIDYDNDSRKSVDSESFNRRIKADFPRRVSSESRYKERETSNSVEKKIMDEINNFIRRNKMGNSQVRLSKKDNRLTIEFVDNKKKTNDDVIDDENQLYKMCKDFSFNTWMILIMASVIIILLMTLFYRNS